MGESQHIDLSHDHMLSLGYTALCTLCPLLGSEGSSLVPRLKLSVSQSASQPVHLCQEADTVVCSTHHGSISVLLDTLLGYIDVECSGTYIQGLLP